MGGIVKFLVTLAVTFIAYGVYRLSRVIYEELTSPMRDLPGPKSTSLLAGSLKDAQQDVCSYVTARFLANVYATGITPY